MADTDTKTEQPMWGATLPAPSAVRDSQGRFLTGNNGGGRRKGSRNKLTERFLDAIADDFAEYGREAIIRVRVADPAAYLKLVGSIVPKELVMQREQAPPINWDEVTYEDLALFIEDRRRQKSMEQVLKSIG